MFILITDIDGNCICVKKSDIRRVYKGLASHQNKTIVSFTGKQGLVYVSDSVKEFYTKHIK